MDRLDSPRLPLLVQNVSSLQDLLTVGAEHALRERETETQRVKEAGVFLTACAGENKDKALLGPEIFPCIFNNEVSLFGSRLNFKRED